MRTELAKEAAKALRHLAEHARPSGGEDIYNSLHLHQLADELEATELAGHTVFKEHDEILGTVRLQKWEDEPRFVLWVGGSVVWDSTNAGVRAARAEMWVIRNVHTKKLWRTGRQEWVGNVALCTIYPKPINDPHFPLPDDGEWIALRDILADV